MDALTLWFTANLSGMVTLAAGLLSAVILLLVLVWLGGIIFSLYHWGAGKRLAYVRLAADRQIIQLQLKKRSQEDLRLGDEIKTLQGAIAQATRREEDLRKLHAAQEENLAARAVRCSKLEKDLQELEDALSEQEENTKAIAEEAAEHEKARTAADKAIAAAREEMANQMQVIRMMESQLSAQRNAANLANAGVDDLRRQVDQLRERDKHLTDQIALLKRLTPMPAGV